MIGTVTQYLQGVGAELTRRALGNVLQPIADRISTQSLNSAGLAIKAGASALVKTGATAYYGVANGGLVTVAAATDMPSLVGTVTNAKYNAYSFFINSSGTVTAQMGVEGATLGAVKFAPIPVGSAQLGFVIIRPTGTGNFVGGTTALDDATVVPNAVYINTIGAFDPTVLF